MVADIDTRSSEEETLNRAISSIDPFLRASLQRDQKRRRKKIALWGILMAMLCFVTVLTLFVCVALPPDVNAAPPTQVGLQIERIERASDLASEGWELFRAKKRHDSAAKFKEALLYDPKSEDAWCGLGYSLWNTGRPTDALNAFEECLKIRSKNPMALNGVGQIKFTRRKYDEAEEYLLESAKSGASTAWSSLTISYLLQGKYDDANKWLKKIKSVGGDYSRLEGIEEAIAERKVSDELRKRLEYPEIKEESEMTRRGWDLIYKRKYRPAMFAFDEALAADSLKR